MRSTLLALAAGAVIALPSVAQDHHGGSHAGGFSHGGGSYGHGSGSFGHGFDRGAHGFGGHGWGGPRFSYPRYYGPRYYGFYDPFPFYGYYPAPLYAPVYVQPPVEYVERYYVEPAPPAEPAPQYSEPQYSYSERSQAQVAPQPAPAQRMERITLSARELFAFDEATLRSPQPKLDEIAAAMKRDPGIERVRITGYTDRIGSASYNQKLSERRANAVKSYLVRQGVEAGRFVAVGKGKANPVVQCDDKKMEDLVKCLEPNRRVEVEQITIERVVR